MSMRTLAVAGLITCAALVVAPAAKAQETLEVWSHEADEPAKVAFRELAARNLEKKHPGLKVKITWYEKNPLFAALKTALPAGKGPDVFYLEPDQTEYITSGYIVPLDDSVNWNNIEPWARKVWTHNGKTYGIPQEAYTVELYYNKDMMKQLGVTLPPNGQLNQSQFLDLVKKARAAGMTPIAQGVGDRPYPAVTSRRGAAAQARTGRLSEAVHGQAVVRRSARRRRAEVGQAGRRRGRLSEELHDAEARRVALLLLQQAGRADAADGQLLHRPRVRARGQGGQPRASRSASCSSRDGRGACNDCKTPRSARASRSTPRASKKKLAAEFLDAMSTPAMGKMWIETVYLQTGIKADVKQFSGPHAAYFTELMDRQKGRRYFVGQPRDMVTGACKDAFAQVLNSGFPGGLLSVDQTVEAMNKACFKG
jgi:multiple sugar transport system substrate-binding protein